MRRNFPTYFSLPLSLVLGLTFDVRDDEETLALSYEREVEEVVERERMQRQRLLDFCKKAVNCRVSLPFAKMTPSAKRKSHILVQPLKSGCLGLFFYYSLVK